MIQTVGTGERIPNSKEIKSTLKEWWRTVAPRAHETPKQG